MSSASVQQARTHICALLFDGFNDAFCLIWAGQCSLVGRVPKKPDIVC